MSLGTHPPQDSVKALAAAVDAAVVPDGPEALVALRRVVDVLMAKVMVGLAACESAGVLDGEAITSLAVWVRSRWGVTGGEARRVARLAHRLPLLPLLSGAWQAGRLTGGQVDVVMAHVTTTTFPRFVADEGWVVPALEGLTIAETEVFMRDWRAHAEALCDPGPESAEPKRRLWHSETLEGRFELSGSFDPEGGAVVEAALRQAERRDHPDDEAPPRAAAERRADALVDVCRRLLDSGESPPKGRERPHVNVIADYDDLCTAAGHDPTARKPHDPDAGDEPRAHSGPGGGGGGGGGGVDGGGGGGGITARGRPAETPRQPEQRRSGRPGPRRSARRRPCGRLLDGTPLSRAALHRLLCDAKVHRVITAGRSAVLDYGHDTRTIPIGLWNALVLRDRGCRVPWCDRGPAWCEGHHVRHWLHGGPTRPENLVMLCGWHHQRFHDAGWQLDLEPDGALHLTGPTGRRHTSRPPLLTDTLFEAARADRVTGRRVIPVRPR